MYHLVIKEVIFIENDIDDFLDIGKENVNAIDLSRGFVHEDEAAEKIATAAAGPGIRITQPSEGRVNLEAEYNGLLKINKQAQAQLNGAGEIVFATLHTNQRVKTDQAVDGTRVIPLVVSEQQILTAEALCGSNYPLVEVKPFQSLKVGMVTTGSEVYHGRIEDAFGPVVGKSSANWEVPLSGKSWCPTIWI